MTHIWFSTPGRTAGLAAFLGLLGLLAAAPSQALPSFARQTGEECTACHIGGFGPQLTPHGTRFKLAGYTDTGGSKDYLPLLSGMLVGSYTHTRKDQVEDAGPYDGKNNNTSLQELSLFAAGRVVDHLGVFAQATYSDIDRKVAMDNLDVRSAWSLDLGGEETLLGISLNNNPGIQDAWNNLPAWRFPYMASELAPGSAAGTLLEGGLEMQVLGASIYGWWNNLIYAELGGYRSLSQSFLDKVNVGADAGQIDGVAPYWRLNLAKDLRTSAYQVGLFGLNADLRPDWHGGPTNKYNDVGADASYTFLGNREHIFTLNTSYIHEHRTLDAAYNAGEASDRKGDADSFNLSGSYYFRHTWGLTAGLFNNTGSYDSDLYVPEPGSGSRVGKPNTSGLILQTDWTPFGKEGSWGSPWANLRLGVQYTHYGEFNGATNDYDGFGRDASDNDTLFLFLWGAI
jgi:hypothetical protein